MLLCVCFRRRRRLSHHSPGAPPVETQCVRFKAHRKRTRQVLEHNHYLQDLFVVRCQRFEVK